MTDDTPEYLKAFGPVEKVLKGFDETDLPHKPVKKPRESAEAQADKIVRGMPESQRVPLGGKGREPEWLLKGTPRPVQVEALRRSYYGWWLKQAEDDPNEDGHRVIDSSGLGRLGAARGWAHFMEQRLGKTSVLLNEFGLLRRDHGVKWAVVFAPNQFKPEWVDEADRFGLDAPAYVLDSSDRKNAQRWIDRNRKFGGLIAVNYEGALSPATMAILEELGGNSLVALDECVSVKNPNGTLSANVLGLCKDFQWRRDLTGKPVVQGPHDLWMQLRMIGALDGFNYYAYRNRYCKMGGFQGKVVKGVKDETVEELQETLAAWSFMARRVNWLKTPGRDYARQHVQMIREQKHYYDAMEKDFLIELARDGFDPLVISADQIVGKMLKLQQIAGGFIIDEYGKPHDIMPRSSNPKLQHVKGMLRDQITDKSIVFAHHTHSIEMLREELAEFNPAFIVGNNQARRFGVDVQSEKRRFNGDSACRVVVGQEQAIRYGHTLMGTPDDPCLTEIFYENNYSLNDRSQCEERPQGAGQVGAISIYDLICAPIDEAPIEALQRKEDVSAAVLNYARSTGVLPDQG